MSEACPNKENDNNNYSCYSLTSGRTDEDAVDGSDEDPLQLHINH